MPEEQAAEMEEYIKGLAGLDYPASRSAIINRARDTGGLDAEVDHVLNQLPDRSYDSLDDIGDEIRRIYREGSTLDGAGPAAPSGLDSREKDLVKEMANPRRGEPT